MPPAFTPSEAGLVDAVGRAHARRRRRRAAAASMSGGLLTVLAVLALAAQPTATDSLRPLPIGPAQGASSGTEASASARTGSAATSEPAEPGDPRTSSTSGAVVGPAPGQESATATPAPGAPVAPAASPRAPGDSTPISTAITVADIAYDQTRPCADISGRPASGWCIQVLSEFTGRSGQPSPLTVALCRLPGFTAASASFSTTNEAGFALYSDEAPRTDLWQYARQHPPRPAPHDRDVRPGRCAAWTTVWRHADNQGTPLPRGLYQLRFEVLAENIAEPNQVLEQGYSYNIE